MLAGRALRSAAKWTVQDLRLPGGARLLVTSNADLATADAVYHSVSAGLKQLTECTHTLLEETDPAKAQPQSLLAVAGAVAGALPGLLSLFAAKRTVTGGTAALAEIAAAAAVIGQLGEGVDAFHDNFRLVPDGEIKTAFDQLSECQRRLAARKLELGTAHASAAAEQARIADTIATLTKALADGTGDEETILADLESERGDLRDQRAKVDVATTNLEVVGAALTAIETFVAAVSAVPQGGKRSPLAEAALYQQLHASESGGFTHVLLVQSQNASTQQVIDDKPLWSKDKFTVMASVTISYMLLQVPEGTVVAAGNRNAVAHGRGDIGSTLNLTVIADESQ